MLVSQSARKICKFVFGSCNEVGVFSFFPPSDCNSANSWFAPRKCQAWRQDTTLANSDICLKPFKCLIIGHARAGALVIEVFNRAIP